MSKLNRVLWSGLVLVGAACGDDVTVAPPPPPPEPGVRAVTVAPDGATIAVGASLTFTAAVTTDPGAAAPTIAWSSSDLSIATVSAAGVATGVAVGSVGIRATATSGTSSASGVATLNVSNTTVTPATVSIQSIEKLGVPQNVNNLFGQVDVRVNLERGGQQVQKVQLLVDGIVVSEQAFASPAAAPAQASGPELVIEEVVFSWNSAAFNSTSGVPNHLNGLHSVSAKVITVENASGTGSPSVQITLNNSNTAIVTLVILNGASIADGTGLTWWTGDAEATALPVIYSVANPTIASVTFFPDGALLSKNDAAAPFVQSWVKGTSFANGGSGGNGLVGVEEANFEVCVTAVVNGEPAGTLGCSDDIVPDLRYDNNGPGAPQFAANPNSRQNGWINGTVGLVGLNTSATDNDWLIAGTPDGGVGGYAINLRIDATAPTTVNAANAATPSATPALPAPSLNNNDYCAVATGTDLLGNESLLPVAGTPCFAPPAGSFVATGTPHLRFGVDIAAPTIAFSGGLAALGATAGRILGPTVGTEFQVTVADAGAIGVSGMLGGAPVIGTVKIFNAAGTACLVGTTAACVAAGTGASFTAAFPLVATNTVAASVIDGYYTAELLAQDAAGNQSAVISRSIVHEVAGNPAVVTNALFNVPLSGSQATFQALASDNLDLRDIQYNLTYAGGLGGLPILYPVQNINATPPVPTVLQNANVSVGTTINGFMRQVEDVTANGPVTVGGQFKPNNLQGIIRDQVQASAAVNTGILAGQVTTGVSYLAAAAPQLINSWAITNAATLVSDNAGPGASVNPLSVTLVADAFGPTATFNAPFTRVDFYASFGGFLVQIGTGTPGDTFDDGAAFGRRHRWTFSWTPGTSVGLGAISLFAIGVNSVGDALVSPVNTNITVTNP